MYWEKLVTPLIVVLLEKGLLFMAALVFCLLFCPYSPYGSLLKEFDHACFFMAGKAWYSGYLPYVDFIDVKGPLLFFVFKIGYALSPGSTVGTFVLFVIILFLTLVFVQLTMNIYLKSKLLSSIGAMLILSLRILPSLSLYGRAEDIIALPIVISVFFGTIYYKYGNVNRNLILFSLSLGTCCALAFLIKFNTCLYFFGIAFSTSIVLFIKKNWISLIQFYCYGFAAFMLTIAPFIIYLYLEDILSAFVGVYFRLNMETYEVMGESKLNKIIPSIALRLINNIYIVPVVLYLVIVVKNNNAHHIFSKSENFYFLISALLLFFAGCGGFLYYMIICSFSTIPLIVAVLHKLSSSLLLHRGLSLCFASVLPLWIACYNDKVPSIIRSIGLNTPYEDINSIDQILKNDKYAKVMYYKSLDMGFGVKGLTLPAYPYWMRLNGLPQREVKKMQTAIQNHRADYVIVSNPDEIQGDVFLESCGYKLITTCRIPERVDMWKFCREQQQVGRQAALPK